MEIRIKMYSVDWSDKKKLKKLGFKIKRDWRWRVYKLTLPNNIDLQASTYCYFIVTTEGKHLGHIDMEPFEQDGALLTLIP